jgi:hypothetical protein
MLKADLDGCARIGRVEANLRTTQQIVDGLAKWATQLGLQVVQGANPPMRSSPLPSHMAELCL